MKFIRRIKSYFYNEEPRRSDVQLAQDFGEFPPWPLDCTGLDRDFTIVRTRGIGGLWVNLSLFKRMLQVRDPSEISPSLHATWREIQLVRKSVASAFQDLRGSARTPIDRFIFFLVILPLLLLSGLVMAPWVLWKFTRLLVNLYRRIPRGVGYFVPLFTQETRIVIKADVLARRTDGDVIIAHEHLHLLQHRNGQLDDKRSNACDILLDASLKDVPLLMYLLEMNEVEARLHELVLSHYRAARQLPLTVGGFVSLLAGSDGVGLQVAEVMGIDRAQTTSEADRYHESEEVSRHFGLIIEAIKDPHLQRRFITEVLTVMYANLIRYYGDAASSRQFLQQLARPNLYDALYGTAAAEIPPATAPQAS